MKTVVFAHPKETLPTSTLLPNKSELFDKIRNRDLNPVVSLNGESAFSENSVEAHELTSEFVTHEAGSIALAEVGVVVNRLDRSVRNSEMPTTWRQRDIPVLNENELRSLVHRKHLAQAEIFEPLGQGIDTQLVTTIEEAALFMALHPADAYIAKPNSGTFSKSIDRLAASQVVAYFKSNPDKLSETVLQPAFDFTIPLPTTVTAYDATSESGFETWARSHTTKELRMYGFYAGGMTDVFPVARAMEQGVDHWFFVDPDSIPESLFTQTRDVFGRAASITGSRAIYGALDIAYGAKSATETPDYHVVELNARMPYLIGYDKHAQVASVLRDKFADQLRRTVTDKRVE